MPSADIIVIGAGAAGLAATAALSQAGCSVLVLEARRRIGGRASTICDPAFGVVIERGAEFIHGRPEATFKRVAQAGLVAYDMPFEHLQRKHGRLEKLEDFSEAISPVMKGLSRLKGPDISFDEYLRTHAKGPRFRDARAMARAFVQGFDAADPARISARSLAKEQEELGDVSEEKQFRLLGGYGELMDWMARTAVRQGAKIHLGTAVEEIRWKRTGIEVLGRRSGGRGFAFRSRHAVVTLPLGVLTVESGPGAVRFVPEIPSKRRAMERLGFGPVVKILLKFDRPFWEEPAAVRAAKAPECYRDLSFMDDPSAEVPTWWTLRLSEFPLWLDGPEVPRLKRSLGAEKQPSLTPASDHWPA